MNRPPERPPLLDVAEALELILDDVRPAAPAEVPLERSRGLALAEEILADRDFPPTDRSAMDGYAVRVADLGTTPTELRLTGELRAGASAAGLALGAGEAVRVFTGSTLPAGCDAVVMVEHTEELSDGAAVRILSGARSGQHIRRRGSERRRGERVLEAGSPIHAPEIAALAAVGRTTVRVHRPLEVHLLTTGDELVAPDQTPLEHQLRDSNGPVLLAQLAEMGLEGRHSGTVADDSQWLAERLRQGLGGDLLLVSGGVSVGRYDLVARTLERLGMRTIFHGVAVKPGKPLLAGRCGRCLVVGLPGNPVSAYAGFAIFVAPPLRKMMGYRRWHNLELAATLEGEVRGRPGRTTYHLAQVRVEAGGVAARPVPTTGSGDLLSMVRANGFLITPPADRRWSTGAQLSAVVWRDFQLRR